MIRVLVVDDSAFMRKAISMMLEDDAEVRVIGTARDGEDAIEKVKRLRPDIVTLDIEMPRMDGLTALKRIMKEHPVPVIMISSLTQQGAQATVEALQAGAVDFIPKQFSYVSLEINKIKDDLIAKVKSIVRSRSRLFRSSLVQTTVPRRPVPASGPSTSLRFPGARLLAIGVSTGGPFALQKIIPVLPKDFPIPVAIVQHMPAHFTRSLAERLDGLSPLRVVEAEGGMRVEPGTVMIAPGGKHLRFRTNKQDIVAHTPEHPTQVLHRPSVDVMFRSACQTYDGRVLALVMTGMGKDGLEGARLIKQQGGRVMAQNEETCVVYGMPKAVVDADLADAVLPLEALAEALSKAVGQGAVPRRASGPSLGAPRDAPLKI
ncbi:MAG: chemotaxis response regulator protein-glutamate methylesterase [Rhodothermales bacterium]